MSAHGVSWFVAIWYRMAHSETQQAHRREVKEGCFGANSQLDALEELQDRGDIPFVSTVILPEVVHHFSSQLLSVPYWIRHDGGGSSSITYVIEWKGYGSQHNAWYPQRT
ncbi:hypothetical protein F5144DRAFT_550806 [Chaetomium tenue]|uniref:Uncharacterized protein n=1 Tax=Chaetomium tenue TaxID=1854479 RepID=A0ACB7NYP5_9PEZI|nr:hypothetical protein F5144DRAFT_550806 [Chaetomium globosum]